MKYYFTVALLSSVKNYTTMDFCPVLQNWVFYRENKNYKLVFNVGSSFFMWMHNYHIALP